MSVGTKSLLLVIALVTAVLILPYTGATTVCSIQSSCSGTDVAVASVATTTGGHAAPTGEFSNVLCCEEKFQDYYYASNDAFTISTIDGNQGHIGSSFDYSVTAGYAGCQIVARDASGPGNEICIAGLANSGGEQGHIAECETTNYNVVCCPWGWDRSSSNTCDERDTAIEIVNIYGPPTTSPSTPTAYRAEIDWSYESPIQGRIYSTPRGSTSEIQSFTFTDANLTGRKNFSETFTFATAGNYTIHAYAEKTDDPSQFDSHQLNITVGSACLNNAKTVMGKHFDACEDNPGDLSTDVDWDPEPGFYCPLGTESCYTANCPPGSSFNATSNICYETNCGDDVDNDRDGQTDIADPDCREFDTPPRVRLTASPLQGPVPLNVTFLLNATDELPSTKYNLTFGDGNFIPTTSGSSTILYPEPHTYTSEGIYTATFTVEDNRGHINSSSVVINVTNDAPTISLSANPTSAPAPNTSDITISVMDDSPNATVSITTSGGTLSTSSLFFDNFSESQTVTLNFTDPGDYEVTATVTDTYGAMQTNTTTITAEKIEGKDIDDSPPPTPDPSECADGYIAKTDDTGTLRCYTNASVSGTVFFEQANGDVIRAYDAQVTLRNDELQDDFTVVANAQGEYLITEVPGGPGYDIRAEFQTYTSTSQPLTQRLQHQVELEDQNITIQEAQQSFPGCTNNQGRCDSAAIGYPGCFNTSDPNYDNYSRVLQACDPSGSAGRLPGDRVVLDRNATHREVANCCFAIPTWEPIVNTDLQADANNLIRYTRTAIYQGQPVRVVIATWN